MFKSNSNQYLLCEVLPMKTTFRSWKHTDRMVTQHRRSWQTWNFPNLPSAVQISSTLVEGSMSPAVRAVDAARSQCYPSEYAVPQRVLQHSMA